MKKPFLTLIAVSGLAVGMLVLVLVGLAGLTTPSPVKAAPQQSSPLITSIHPHSAPNDLDTSIVITGTGFSAVLSGTHVLTPPIVTLDGFRLPYVGFVSNSVLTATVPWGLQPDVYNLTVTNPDGDSNTLANAFEVIQGIGVWTTGGPYGGEIHYIQIDPADSNRILATAWDSGIFATDNGADRWSMVWIESSPGFGTYDALDSSLMYAGSYGHGAVRTTDAWQSRDNLPMPTELFGTGDTTFPVAHPDNANQVFLVANAGKGLYRSTDKGQSWNKWNTGLTDTQVTALAFDPANANRMVLGTDSGNVFVSTNGGQVWSFGAKVATHIEYLAINPFGGREVWASIGIHPEGCSTPGLYRSQNTALTVWSPITVQTTLPNPGAGGECVGAVTFHPALSGTMWAGLGTGFGFSGDGGAGWDVDPWSVQEKASIVAVDPHAPADMGRSTLYASASRGIFKSLNGGNSWHEVNQGLSGVVPQSIAVSPVDPGRVYVLGPGLGFLSSSDGGQSWQIVERQFGDSGMGAAPYGVAVDPFNPSRIYHAGGDGGNNVISISPDQGLTWQERKLPLPAEYAAHNVHAYVVVPHPGRAGRLMAGVKFEPGGWVQFPDGGVYASSNSGQNWTYLDLGDPISAVTTIAMDPVDQDVIYVGTNGTGILKSSDNGVTWNNLTPDVTVWSVAIHPADHNTVYAAGVLGAQAEGTMFKSTDAGQTWTSASGGTIFDPTWVLVFGAAEPYPLYAATMNNGLYRSDDGGATWQQPSGIPSHGNVKSLATVSADGRSMVYIGTSGGVMAGSAAVGLNATAEQILGAGVYRYTQRVSAVYLPQVIQE